MDELPEIHTSELTGSKFFRVEVHHEIQIESIVNCFLYATELDDEDFDQSRQPPTPWTKWDRATAIRWVRHWIAQEGSKVNAPSAYPKARRLYGGMALRFAEELFPELVYDYEEAVRRIKAAVKKIAWDEDLDLPF